MIHRQQLDIFRSTLEEQAASYRVSLSPSTIESLVIYYGLLLRWNDRLHLVAPCTPQVFATRHVLESLLLLPHIQPDAALADIGSGAGLPIIPCLIVRPDLCATLIESSTKKSVFLREVLRESERTSLTTVITQRFEEVETPQVSYVTCRALDDFSEKLKTMYEWAPAHSTLLLFGGPSLAVSIQSIHALIETEQIPNSAQRFLYKIEKQERPLP